MSNRLAIALILISCSDYELDNKGELPDITETDTDTDTDADTDSDTDPVTCDDFDFSWIWIASASFDTQPDPTDAGGLPFHDPGFDDSGYLAQILPDQSVPVGFDRAYRAQFELSQIPPSLLLDMQSDDGIWVWLNGGVVGHWGGDWQQEGCVNENAQCIVTETVPPQDVTSFLQIGTNTLAARLSNPIMNSWIEIVPICVD